ncbi:MAG: NAD(P)/FAD-dependent oxidoreductase [Fusobacteriaceae bacterium]
MKYVILGASAAGINGAATLRELDQKSEIVLISTDDKIYSRCMLHLYIKGERDINRLNFISEDFFEKNSITWLKNKTVVSLNSKENFIILNNNEKIYYDKILLATGSHSFIPKIENFKEAPNLIGLRTLNDCTKIKLMSQNTKNIVILGGGLIGIDALSGLLDSRANLTLIESGKNILPLQLDSISAETYSNEFKNKGVKQYFNSLIVGSEIDSSGNITSLELKTGEKISTDMIIVATGVRANIDFLKDSDVVTNKFGLEIDSFGRTNIPNIYGAGDITGTSPVWPAAVKEGIIAASNMANIEIELKDFFCNKSSMNFFGIPTVSIGNPNLSGSEYTIDILHTETTYKKIIHKDGKIYGALVQGDISYSGILTQIIKDKIDISKIKKSVFNIDYSDFFNIKNNLEFTY